MGSSATKRLGILAGSGRLPVLVAESARARGFEVVAFGFEKMMSEELGKAAAKVHAVPFAQVGALIGRMQDEGIEEAVTIGAIAQTSVVEGRPRFDEVALKLWRKLPDLRVDSVMLAIIEELAERGIRMRSAIEFLDGFMAPPGTLTLKKPTAEQWSDIRFGFRMAKAVGGYDIGQTVVIKNRAVMAVEAVEGTDRAIKRGGELAKSGAVVVKAAKPRQDMRFDVPAAGRETIAAMKSAGAAVLALEAGQVLLVERDAMIADAGAAGIAVVGVTEEEAGRDG